VEKHKLKFFENMVLRKTVGRKGDEVTDDWRRLHIEEVHDQYSLSYQLGWDRQDL
jgi:hypothetical protein